MNNLLFLGGDKRSITAYNTLKNLGYNVDSLGLFENDSGDFDNADVIILPVPSTRDKQNVFCPLTNKKIPLSEVEKNSGNRLVIGCGIKPQEQSVDILELDGYAYLNAVPTAEGAIAFAINNTPFTLWNANVLVVGNGRVAKVLIERLSGFRCNLTVSARKDRDFAILDTKGIPHINTSDVPKLANSYDIIFNTVDVKLFESFENLKSTVLIDLSTKGCLDFTLAESLGISAYKLPGIPGKTAPVTSGKILADTINTIINSSKNNG